MIGTVVRVGLLRMWHGRTEILLNFVVPIAFFTIFAFIFDEQIGLGKSPKVNVALVDDEEVPADLLTINLGPSHPATHGALRIEALLDGETIVKARSEIGYLHRCFENRVDQIVGNIGDGRQRREAALLHMAGGRKCQEDVAGAGTADGPGARHTQGRPPGDPLQLNRQ